MRPTATRPRAPLPPELVLPATFLGRYLMFLGRRPISRSNRSFVESRLTGLKALGTRLAARPEAVPVELTARLHGLHVATLRHLVPSLHAELQALAALELPPDVILSPEPPAPGWFRGTRRVVLVFGPAIGVGDEVACFRLVPWLRQLAPEARLSIVTTYAGLWDRVEGVDDLRVYQQHGEVVDTLRAEGHEGAADLVLLIDFERPGLLAAMCAEPRTQRYVELALGTRELAVWDGHRRWVHRHTLVPPYFGNLYHGLDQLLDWLGGAPRGLPLPCALPRLSPRTRGPEPEGLELLVVPFTSKYDPEEEFWGRLVASVVPPHLGPGVRFVFDPGPNASTLGFARRLCRDVSARGPRGARYEVAGDGAPLPLSGVFGHMERAHAVLCTDTFAAHAAPLFGCTTLVLAREGLQDWRVPAPRSFYFHEHQPLPRVTAAMAEVLSALASAREEAALPPRWSALATPLLATFERLSHGLSTGAPDGVDLALQRAWEDAQAAWCDAVNGTRAWPEAFHELFADCDLVRLRATPRLERGTGPSAQAQRRHLEDVHARRLNSNLYKYLRLRAEASAPGARS